MSTARVDFTRGAAERIAAVVRTVEQGDRDQTGPRWGRVLQDVPQALKLATFSGDWAINTYKTVTFHGVTSTPNTAQVLNLCNAAVGFSTANTSESRFVVFGKVRYTTDPVVVEIQSQPEASTCVLSLGSVDLTGIPGFSAGEVQLLGHAASSCLYWYSITTCATATT